MIPGRVFLYELITGGGMWCLPDSPAPLGSLLSEGEAMLRALAADLVAAGVEEVSVLRDARCGPLEMEGLRCHSVDSSKAERNLFLQQCRSADRVIVIAPEFEGLLAARVAWAESVDPQKLASPGSELVRLGSDKWATYSLLQQKGIPVVETHQIAEGRSWAHLEGVAVVTKPHDGAGSEDIEVWESGRSIPRQLRQRPGWLIQPKLEGIPVSVSLIGNSTGLWPLPPCRQLLSRDLKYLGGRFDLSADLWDAASELALRIAEIFYPFMGYLGIDMILEPAGQGAKGLVVEINPRLTTSYIGLRRVVDTNLAAVMLGAEKIEPPYSREQIADLEFHV